MTKLRGLGRGLDALLSASEINNSESISAIEQVSLERIKPSKFQPRQIFDEVELKELAASIKQNGIIQPLVVRKDGAVYEIIAGERRFRASKIAELKSVPVIVKSFSDEEALAIAIIENIQRKDLNIIEESLGYKRLIEEFKLTHEKISQITGRSRSHVSNMLRLLNLHHEVQEMLMHGKLDMGHARALLSLPKLEQVVFAHKIFKSNLTTAETERQVAQILQGNETSKMDPLLSKGGDIIKLEHKLSKKLGLPVTIKKSKIGGKVTFSYKTVDELYHLVKIL